MPSAQKPAGAEGAERALSRDQPVAADAAAPTPANQGSASAAGAEFTDEDLQQDPLGSGDNLRARDRTDRRTAGQQDSRTAQDSRPQDTRHGASTLPPVAAHYVGLARGVGVGLGSKTRVKPC